MTLSPERWQRIKEVLDAALERPAPEREAFLREACGGDSSLREEVESLLASAPMGERLERPLLDDASPLFEVTDETGDSDWDGPLPGRRIGAYRIVRELGRGGMGAVYLAVRDDDEFQKQVAIKILPFGASSPDILRRFRNERQILASIEHPNIARLLDGGSTEDGLPYFVMEHIDGLPIDDYCDEHRLSIDQRLKLVQTVCAAVHFAHQNLVIHRDLKPANILVTPEATPKLLDFGIAKLLSPDQVPGSPDPTVSEGRPMTPAYASPEQVRGETVTTASDVYSLGVLLYELLTGHRPYRLENRSFHAVASAICEREPVPPSVVVDLVEELPGHGGTTRVITPEGVSTTREGTTAQLRRRLRGDLDNICLLAMRKEAKERYGSAEQLSDDVGRFLEGLPVKARKPTFVYRSSKFIRRHRLGVAAAALFLVALATFSVLLVQERDRAQEEADKAAAINRFLQETLRATDPVEGLRLDVTLVEALDGAVGSLGSSFSEQPEVRAELELTIGVTYYRLGEFEKGEALLQSAMETLEGSGGGESPGLADVLEALSLVYSQRGEHEMAAALLVRALAIRVRAFGSVDPSVAGALNRLGVQYGLRGAYDEAESAYRRALEIREETQGPHHADVCAPLSNLGGLYATHARTAEAEPLLQRALQVCETSLGPEHPTVAVVLGSLAATRFNLREVEEAERLLVRALEIEETALRPDHPEIAKTLHNLGAVYIEQGRYAEAEPLLARSLKIAEEEGGAEHVPVARTLGKLAVAAVEQGRLGEAESLLQRALPIAEEALGPEDRLVGTLLDNLGKLRRKQGRPAEGEVLCRRALEIRQKALGPDHTEVGISLRSLAASVAAQGRPDEARRLYKRALEIYESGLGPEHPACDEIREALAELPA